MDEENKSQELNNPEQSADAPAETPATGSTDPIPPASGSSGMKKWLLIAGIVLLLGLLVAGYFLFFKDKDDSGAANQDNSASQQPAEEDSGDTEDEDEQAAIDCGTMRWYADPVVGMAFCYPNDWGEPSVADAKFDASDTGHRQIISFADNPNVIVGGVSEDWSTTVGRDGTCLSPDNRPLELSEYDTEWHNIQGTGADVTFAMRSLPATGDGGYDLSETVSNMLSSGVCASGHKVIAGSRYNVAFAAYYREFGGGVTTPRNHMDSPNVLFSEDQRAEMAQLMDSIIAYPAE